MIIKSLVLILFVSLVSNSYALISQFVQIGGKITLSTDGCSAQNRADMAIYGTPKNDTCTITINKPTGATLNKAILLAAGDVEQSSPPLLAPITTIINGITHRPNLTKTTSDVDSINSLTSHVHYDDITTVVSAALNGLSVGNNTLQLIEEDGRSLEGMQLFVIWNDPNTANTIISISLGTVDTLTGINETINTLPIDTTDPAFKVTSGISIIYSTGDSQTPDWKKQISELRLNGNVFSTEAGGHDDGLEFNGTLFTAGGEGDSVSSNAFDELYDASSVVNNGDISLNYSTTVPSGHIFDWLVAMWVQGKGVIIDTPTTTANISGTVFEDINYGGGIGRSYNTANTSYAATNIGTEATVELWASDGNTCTGTTPIQTTSSNTFDGAYTFSFVTGNAFCVRVVNNSIQHNLVTINGSNTPLPIQTYRTESTSGTGSITAITNEIGGRSPLDADVATNTFDTSKSDGSISQSWSVVNISGGDVSGIDFGFNFNTIVNTNDAGQGSLRQFIINANTIGNETTLAQTGQTASREVSIFMLPNGTNYAGMTVAAGNVFNTGVATINLQSELPSITRNYVDIDATTQINSNCLTPLVELNGAAAGSAVSNLISNGQGISGLTIRRDHHYIRGLIINRFASSGIELFRDNYPLASDSSDNTHIECNWIGLDKTGNNAQGNGEWGVVLWGMNSFVGNGTVTGRNVISGNTFDGIMNAGGGSLDNTLQGNYIGTNAAGTAAVGNGHHGIQYYNTAGTNSGNVAMIKGNTIAYNGLSGIGIARTIPKARKIHISQNSIFSNAELGIDLVGSGTSGSISDGVTLNDVNDVDSASTANGLQNFPIISSALKQGSDVEISGTLNSLANKNYDIELYANQTCNANTSGTASAEAYGEGESYLTTLPVTTNANGNANFTITLPYASLNGDYLTSLASNSTTGDNEEGNTSEFSACALAASCNALSGEIVIATKTAEQLQQNKPFFITSTTLTSNNREGHLRAYPIGINGIPSNSTNWDAANKMNQATRDSTLYSSDSSNTITLFNNLDVADFSSSTPNASTIKNYTINPSYNSGSYLAGRRSGSFLGAISPDSTLTLLTKSPDVLTYMNDVAYRSFFTSTIQNRTERALFSSDDGFLYAINTSDGSLGWGWMPSSIVPELKNYAALQNQHLMKGHINVLDLKNSNGNYASYIIGSYKSGLGQYVLKLDTNGKPDSIIWDNDETLTNPSAASAPNRGQATYFSDQNSKVHSAVVINNTDGTSFLKIRSLTDSTVDFNIQLTYTATSVPYIISDFGNNNAPAKKTLYLGDNNGNIYSAALLSSGTLDLESTIKSAITSSAIATMNNSNSAPVLFIGAVASSSDKGYYLRTQTKERLTLFKFNDQSSSWQRLWGTSIGSAGQWANGTNYTTDNAIQTLPTDAQISAEAYTIANSIVLPVTTDPVNSNCYRNAHYYLYKLTDGHFPIKTFYNADNSEITTTLALGKGEAKRLKIADLAGADKLVGFGAADQKATSATTFTKAIYIHEGFTTGLRSWRELR
jgi:hypothetical protein